MSQSDLKGLNHNMKNRGGIQLTQRGNARLQVRKLIKMDEKRADGGADLTVNDNKVTATVLPRKMFWNCVKTSGVGLSMIVCLLIYATRIKRSRCVFVIRTINMPGSSVY